MAHPEHKGKKTPGKGHSHLKGKGGHNKPGGKGAYPMHGPTKPKVGGPGS